MSDTEWTSPDGSIRLICGDCRDWLGRVSFDHMMTDPPYGVGKADWDSEFPTDWYRVAAESCKGTSFIMSGNSALPKCIEMVGEHYRDVFVLWLSNGMTLGPVSFGNWIPVVVAQRERCYLGNQNLLRVVVNCDEKIDHPSPKPLDAMLKLVDAHTESGELICDPFMGSGTTGKACARLGRRFIGIEKEPKYFAIARDRIIAELSRQPLFKEPTEKQVELFNES